MTDREHKRPEQYPEVDIREVLREPFSAGRGVIQLQPDMTDEALLFVAKQAIALSSGKAFTVIPARTAPDTH